MLTLKKVNKALEELGAKEILVKGEDYYYFTEGNSYSWDTTCVMVMKLNDLTLEEWISEWKTYSYNNVYHKLKDIDISNIEKIMIK